MVFVAVEATVWRVERVSPSFVRIGFTTPPGFGRAGPVYDQRIKVVFPGANGLFRYDGPDWFERWCTAPVEVRGAMRTYSIRAIERPPQSTRVTIDIVLHPGAEGPASAGAARAQPGDRVMLLGPSRDGPVSGIEFAPGKAERIILAGDETAAPAIARILEDLPRRARGIAYIEVPVAADRLPIDAPPGIRVVWLPREGTSHGSRLAAALLPDLTDPDPDEPVEEPFDAPLVWETPTYSSRGEPVAAAVPATGTYWWIAGEAGMVTRLRRRLIRGYGVERHQIAFMGYWRQGLTLD